MIVCGLGNGGLIILKDRSYDFPEELPFISDELVNIEKKGEDDFDD